MIWLAGCDKNRAFDRNTSIVFYQNLIWIYNHFESFLKYNDYFLRFYRSVEICYFITDLQTTKIKQQNLESFYCLSLNKIFCFDVILC